MHARWYRSIPVYMAEGGPTGGPSGDPAQSGSKGFSADYVARLQADMDKLKDENRDLKATNKTALDELTAKHAEAIKALAAEHAATLEAAKSEAAATLDAAKAEAAKQVEDMQTATRRQTVAVALRAAATAAGLVDPDGLKLLDPAEVEKLTVGEAGKVDGATPLVDALKKAKPFLFGTGSTSNPTPPPNPAPAGGKTVKDMTDDEFRAAVSSRSWRDRAAA